MKSYKTFKVGRARQVDNLDVVEVTLPVKAVIDLSDFMEDDFYFTFDLVKMKETDKFGMTHECIVTKIKKVPSDDKIEIKLNEDGLPF